MNKLKKTSELMQCYPVRLLEWDEDETGMIVIRKPKFNSDWAMKLFNPILKSKEFKINLDELGSVVWKYCDGKKSVDEIGMLLAKHFGPDIEPIYDRLTKFIMQLYRGKFIEIRCQE
jgi:hypothetical protein